MLAAVLAAAAVAGAPPSVRGDFDRDGKVDVAEFVAAQDGDFRLVIRPGDRRRPMAVIETVNRAALGDIYLEKAKPGRYRTWCGKGGGGEGDPCPVKAVRLRGAVLSFGKREASQSVVIWNGRRFEVVLLSD
jgi:hypothetical protein